MCHAMHVQDVNTFPFEVIRKWLPSNIRSRNPGAADCLDLQVGQGQHTTLTRAMHASLPMLALQLAPNNCIADV